FEWRFLKMYSRHASSEGNRFRKLRMPNRLLMPTSISPNCAVWGYAPGYAHEYTYDLPYKYQKEFKAAEHAAREAQKGLWAPDTCNGDAQ
ncbi:thermonuclease family protein, partial [Candidatus Kaiserbacteria bacterium]|nr:thermonuclease family protein [Candidatus Kaiserbacteria bacterium]